MDINEYKNLPSYENLTRPKFMQFLEAVLKPAIDLGVSNDSIYSAFDLENAAGVQLDIIGEIVGLSRLLPFKPTVGSREMDDEEYRWALRLKIARNEWDGTNEGAKRIYDECFSGTVSVSFHEDYYQEDPSSPLVMQVTIEVRGAVSTKESEIMESGGLLMIPAGVSHIVEVVSDASDISASAGFVVTGEEIWEGVTMLQEVD